MNRRVMWKNTTGGLRMAKHIQAEIQELGLTQAYKVCVCSHGVHVEVLSEKQHAIAKLNGQLDRFIFYLGEYSSGMYYCPYIPVIITTVAGEDS